jgi:hypothetical protein
MYNFAVEKKTIRCKKRTNQLIKQALWEFLNKKEKKLEETLKTLQEKSIDSTDEHKLVKLMMLIHIGSFFGEHTLCGLLKSIGVSNTKAKFWQQISNKTLLNWMILQWKEDFKVEYLELCSKSDSTKSRAEMTIINDESVFKMWLTDSIESSAFSRFFSGQTRTSVYGFKLSLLGVCLQDRFYPLDYVLFNKGDKTDLLSIDLLDNLKKWLTAITPEKTSLHLYLSVDSGYHSKKLINHCKQLAISLICVPKGNHRVIYEDKSLNINDLKGIFIKKESEEVAKNEGVKNPDKAFTLRIRVAYESLGTVECRKEVTMLIFRLNRSKKVSVIYSPDLNIKAKTLRRRWFQRTHIEQFFRLMKHSLKIQDSKSENQSEFLKKFALIGIKAMSWMQVRDIVRKKTKNKKITYIEICRFIKRELGLNWLKKVESTGGFSFKI